MFHIIKPVINEHISWFVYEKGSPVGMWINLPDLNEWFRYLNGKFRIWEKIKFIFIRQFVPNKKMIGLVFGVVPEWQKGYRWLYDMGRNTASEKVYSFRGNRNAVDRRFQS